MKLWTSCVGAFAVVLLVLLSAAALKGCWGGGESCERDLDCLILCECAGVDGFISVGPYQCRLGTCGSQHYSDMDCERPCADAFVPNFNSDDDDSAGDDDDSSAGDDDSSAGS